MPPKPNKKNSVEKASSEPLAQKKTDGGADEHKEEGKEQTTAWFGIINSEQTPWQKDLDKKVREQQAKKKEIPPLKDLLKYGDPESRDEPKTWWDIYGPGFQLFVVFVLSLIIFHNLKEYAPTKRYNIPGMQRLPIFKDNVNINDKIKQHREQIERQKQQQQQNGEL